MKDTQMFDIQNRVKADDCAITAKEYQNASINDYSLWNTYFMACDESGEKQVEEFAAKNINLHYRNGVGMTTACHIDNDTDMRNNAVWTSEKPRTQLYTRFYQANPNMTRGVPQPHIENPLIQGNNIKNNSYRNELEEQNYDRFVPFVPYLQENIQNVENIVLPFHQTGADTREIMRSRQRDVDPQTVRRTTL
jgi:hypothetical protein